MVKVLGIIAEIPEKYRLLLVYNAFSTFLFPMHVS